jgi:hypothetical protein
MLIAVPQPSGQFRAELTVLRIDDVLTSVFHGHARGREAVKLVRAERVGVRLVPAQGLEVQLDLLLESRFRERER